MIYLKFLRACLLYVPLTLASIVLAIVANIFCWLIAFFVDNDGNLPYLLRWFQTPDATCYDVMWVAENPTWSKYKIATTWIARNPAYGFRKWVSPDPVILQQSLDHEYGDLYIADGAGARAGWFLLIDKSGYWNFSYIINLHNGHCMRGTCGWNLVPIAKGYESVNTGMLESDLVRFYNFGAQGK